MFNSIFFQLRSKCNGRCDFCLASVKTDPREDISMSFDLYTNVLEQLKSLGWEGRIAYHVNNEPLLVQDLDKFVALATSLLPTCKTQVLTNGVLLNRDWARRLLDAGLKELTVNYYCHERVDLNPKLREASDVIQGRLRYRIFPRNEHEVMNSRGGTSPNKKCTGMARGYCEYPFTQFNISERGLVSKCCADVLFSDPMGDLLTTPLIEIWNGEKFQHVRKSLRDGDRQSLPNCRDCDFSGDRRMSKTK